MATKTFAIDSYQVSMGYELTLGATYEFRRVIACYGEGHRFIVYFQADGASLYPPFTNLPYKFGRIFLPVSEFQSYLDVLRNEKPLYAYLSSDKPSSNHLRSSLEPVGEEEA